MGAGEKGTTGSVFEKGEELSPNPVIPTWVESVESGGIGVRATIPVASRFVARLAIGVELDGFWPFSDSAPTCEGSARALAGRR